MDSIECVDSFNWVSFYDDGYMDLFDEFNGSSRVQRFANGETKIFSCRNVSVR